VASGASAANVEDAAVSASTPKNPRTPAAARLIARIMQLSPIQLSFTELHWVVCAKWAEARKMSGIPKFMRALRLNGPGNVAVEEVPVPIVGVGDVLLRVLAAGVCRTDLHIRHDHSGGFPPGTILGHEIAGEIAALGGGDAGPWKVGDRVVVHPCWACHVCPQCRAGRENACQGRGGARQPPPTPGVSVDGGMADYVAVPAASLIGIGDLDPAIAAVLADAALTPYHSIRLQKERLSPGTTAVVMGLGGLGQFAVQILAVLTSARIIGLDISADALALAAEHCDLTLRADRAELVDAILADTQGRGADVVIDLVGTDASAVVSPYGAIQAIGLGGGAAPFEAAQVSSVGLPWGATLMKPYSGSYRDLADVVALARGGKLQSTLQRFSLDDAVIALDELDAGRIRGRAVLIP
jgi:propanol-preferring alcohol dehydrogenase